MAADESGPVLSGWLLGSQLKEAREGAGRTVAGTAKELDVHEQTIRRWENAEVTPGLMQLRYLCEFYGIPRERRPELEGLRERAAQPGWWNGRGKWPDATFELLGMEMAAVRIRSWDLTAIPGLLQTPEYTRLILRSVEPNIAPPRLDADVDLRMGRQNKVFGGLVRDATFMIDQLALARMPGTVAIRRAQVARLLTPPPPVTIQIVPFRAGPHPALGTFAIFDFDSEKIRAGVHVEGSVTAKGLVETGKDVARYEQVWAWLQAKALSPEQTKEFLEEIMEGIVDDG